jgi:hypothetical protein
MEALRLDFLERGPEETQEEFILRVLKTQGFITRNFCLQRFISRLGSRICDLVKQGYKIRGHNEKTQYGMDYKYELSGGQDGHSREDCSY